MVDTDSLTGRRGLYIPHWPFLASTSPPTTASSFHPNSIINDFCSTDAEGPHVRYLGGLIGAASEKTPPVSPRTSFAVPCRAKYGRTGPQ